MKSSAGHGHELTYEQSPVFPFSEGMRSLAKNRSALIKAFAATIEPSDTQCNAFIPLSSCVLNSSSFCVSESKLRRIRSWSTYKEKMNFRVGDC